MDFDVLSGQLWTAENGDDSFDELNRVVPGFNSGWIQIMGPSPRLPQFKSIEISTAYYGLQQSRWPPTLLARTPSEARSRLFAMPGSAYSEPEFSWKFSVAPAALGFVGSSALGAGYRGDLLVGAGTTRLRAGYLFRFDLTSDRTRLLLRDLNLRDRVADNSAKYDITESEGRLFGVRFGISADIKTGPAARSTSCRSRTAPSTG
jgi:glucose/arabinose dehydrogenase